MQRSFNITRADLLRIIIAIYTIMLFMIDPNSASYKSICIITIINLVFIFVMFGLNGMISIRNPIFLLLITTTLFTFGQNIAYPFIGNASIYGNDLLINYYPEFKMNRGSLFTIQAFNALILGLSGRNIRYTFGNNNGNDEATVNESTMAEAGLYFGSIVSIVSFIPQIMYIWVNLSQYISLGYGYNANDQLSGIVLRLHYLFIPALLILIASKLYLHKNLIVEKIVIYAQIIALLAMGDRGTGLAIFVAYVWLRAISDEKFTFRHYIIPIIAAIILVPVVKYYRIFFSEGAAEALGDAFIYAFQHNPIIDILLETGGTQRIIVMTMDKVASEGFANGAAYLDFFIKMLPSFLGVHQNYGTLSQWVINSNGYQSYGFSIWAENYLNFGYWGIIFMLIIGIIIKHLLKLNTESINLSWMRISIFLYFFSDISRRSISEFGYNFLYDFIVPLIIVYFIYVWLNKRKNQKLEMISEFIQ